MNHKVEAALHEYSVALSRLEAVDWDEEGLVAVQTAMAYRDKAREDAVAAGATPEQIQYTRWETLDS